MKTVVSIPGMHCDSCISLISEVSHDFPAIRALNIDLKTKRVELEHAEDLDVAAWTSEVESLGGQYKITPIS